MDLLSREINMNLAFFINFIIYYSKDEINGAIKNMNLLFNSFERLCDLFQNEILELECLRLKSQLLYYQNNEDYKFCLERLENKAKEYNSNYYLTSAISLKELFSKYPSYFETLYNGKNIKLDDLSEEEIDEYHRLLIDAAGFDLEKNGHEEQIIKVGLKDRNIERICKNCSHIEFFYLTSRLGELVGLETIGAKFLSCNQCGFKMMGFSFDDLYDELERNHCQNCNLKNPMADDWKWSYKWRIKKMNNLSPEFKKFIKSVGFDIFD